MPDLGQQEFDAMRERAQHTKDGLIADKMRYRRALLIACGGDERKALQALRSADDAPSAAASGQAAVQEVQSDLREQSLAMMIRMLCSHTANDGTRKRAMELLCKYGLQGSPLRDAAASQPSAQTDDALEVLRAAPNLSMYHGVHGFEVERFISAYEGWRDRARKLVNGPS